MGLIILFSIVLCWLESAYSPYFRHPYSPAWSNERLYRGEISVLLGRKITWTCFSSFYADVDGGPKIF